MFKYFSPLALSALIIFTSSYGETTPRRKMNDGRAQQTRARLAARLEARQQEEDARRPSLELNSAEGERKPLEIPSLKQSTKAQLEENFRQLTQGQCTDLSFTAIKSLVLNDVDTFIDEEESHLASFQASQVSHPVDSPVANSGSYEHLPTFFQQLFIANMKEDIQAISREFSVEQLDETLTNPTTLLRTVLQNFYALQNDILRIKEVMDEAIYYLDDLNTYTAPPTQFPLGEITPMNHLHSLVFSTEKGLKILSIHYGFQKAVFPLFCAIEALDPTNKSFTSFRTALRDTFSQYIIKTVEFENLMNRYNYFLQLDEEDRENKTEYAKYIDRTVQDRTIAIRLASEQSDQEFWEMEQATRAAVKELLEQKRAQNSNSRRQRGRRSVVTAIQTQQELQRLQKQVARPSASAAVAADAPVIRESAPLTNVDAFRNWFYDSYTQFENTAKREVRAQTQEQETRAQRKAEGKAAKSHEVDPERSSRSAGAGTAGSSSSDEASEVHTPVTYLDKTPWSRFQAIFEETDREFTMDEVASVIKALNGYVDPKRAGSRVKLALQNLQTGHNHTRVIHDHLSNGHKGLEGGRMSSVRELFIEAGYTPETVRCASDFHEAGAAEAAVSEPVDTASGKTE